MKQEQFQLDNPGYQAAVRVIEVLTGKGQVAYLAGGCVRDLLLGVHPKDFDVATDATPDQIKAYFSKTASVGAAFGVMLVRDFDKMIEVATFRSDGVYSDARRPDRVEFCSPMQDAKRRDFTINALFIDPLADDGSHRIIDYVDGQVDVQRRVLRAVGEPSDRLAEDHLRALRAVRFAARYGLKIDEPTAKAISEHASELRGVSVERIGEELRRMLIHPTRAQACVLIDQLGLDDAIFGDCRSFDPTVIKAMGEEISYSAALVGLAFGRGFEIGDAISPLCSQYRKALDLSNADRDAMRSTLESLWEFSRSWDLMGEAQQKRLASRPFAEQALCVLGAIDRGRTDVILGQIEVLRDRFGGLRPEPMVTGTDLIELGLEPGPKFKQVLDMVYDQQLEGCVLSQPEAIAFVQRQAGIEPKGEPN